MLVVFCLLEDARLLYTRPSAFELTYLDLLLLQHKPDLIDSLLQHVDCMLVDWHTSLSLVWVGAEDGVDQIFQLIDIFLIQLQQLALALRHLLGGLVLFFRVLALLFLVMI